MATKKKPIKKVSKKSTKKTPVKKLSKKGVKKKVSKKTPVKKKKVMPKPKTNPYEGCSAYEVTETSQGSYLGFPRNVLGLVPYPYNEDNQGNPIDEVEANALFIIDSNGYGYGLWPDMDTFLLANNSKDKPKHVGRYRLQHVLLEPTTDMGKFLNVGLTQH